MDAAVRLFVRFSVASLHSSTDLRTRSDISSRSSYGGAVLGRAALCCIIMQHAKILC